MAASGSLERMVVIAYKDKQFTQQVGEFPVTINPASYSQLFEIPNAKISVTPDNNQFKV